MVFNLAFYRNVSPRRCHAGSDRQRHLYTGIDPHFVNLSIERKCHKKLFLSFHLSALCFQLCAFCFMLYALCFVLCALCFVLMLLALCFQLCAFSFMLSAL